MSPRMVMRSYFAVPLLGNSIPAVLHVSCFPASVFVSGSELWCDWLKKVALNATWLFRPWDTNQIQHHIWKWPGSDSIMFLKVSHNKKGLPFSVVRPPAKYFLFPLKTYCVSGFRVPPHLHFHFQMSILLTHIEKAKRQSGITSPLLMHWWWCVMVSSAECDDYCAIDLSVWVSLNGAIVNMRWAQTYSMWCISFFFLLDIQNFRRRYWRFWCYNRSYTFTNNSY